jgi:hypothetical protein
LVTSAIFLGQKTQIFEELVRMVKGMNRSVQILLVLLAMGGCAGIYLLYNALYNVILDSKYVDHFHVEVRRGTHPTELEISGEVANSGTVVRTVSEKKKARTIIVKVHLALAGLDKSNTSARFDYVLSVPDSVNEVRFGRSSTLIWKRGASPTTPISK